MIEPTLTSSRLFFAYNSVFLCAPEIAALPIKKGWA